MGDKDVRVFFRLGQQNDGEQALYGEFFVQHLADGLCFELSILGLLGVVQEVDDYVGGSVHNDVVDEVPEVHCHVGELVVSGLVGSVKKLEGQKILGIVHRVALQLGVGQGLDDGAVACPVDHLQLLAEGQGLGCYVENANLVRLEVAEGSGLAGAGVAQNKNRDAHVCASLKVHDEIVKVVVVAVQEIGNGTGVCHHQESPEFVELLVAVLPSKLFGDFDLHLAGEGVAGSFGCGNVGVLYVSRVSHLQTLLFLIFLGWLLRLRGGE